MWPAWPFPSLTPTHNSSQRRHSSSTPARIQCSIRNCQIVTKRVCDMNMQHHNLANCLAQEMHSHWAGLSGRGQQWTLLHRHLLLFLYTYTPRRNRERQRKRRLMLEKFLAGCRIPQQQLEKDTESYIHTVWHAFTNNVSVNATLMYFFRIHPLFLCA